MPYSERERFSRDITRKKRTDGLRRIMDSMPDIPPMDDEEILAECKAARKEFYDRRF